MDNIFKIYEKNAENKHPRKLLDQEEASSGGPDIKIG